MVWPFVRDACAGLPTPGWADFGDGFARRSWVSSVVTVARAAQPALSGRTIGLVTVAMRGVAGAAGRHPSDSDGRELGAAVAAAFTIGLVTVARRAQPGAAAR